MPVDCVPLGAKLKPTGDDRVPVENRKNRVACPCQGKESALVAAILGFTGNEFAGESRKLRILTDGESQERNPLLLRD